MSESEKVNQEEPTEDETWQEFESNLSQGIKRALDRRGIDPTKAKFSSFLLGGKIPEGSDCWSCGYRKSDKDKIAYCELDGVKLKWQHIAEAAYPLKTEACKKKGFSTVVVSITIPKSEEDVK